MHKISDRRLLPYAVGGLLYMPALNRRTAAKVLSGDLEGLTSVAFCLEDSVEDSALPEAEHELCETLNAFGSSGGGKLPMLFCRVRSPEHLRHVGQVLAGVAGCLTGYILPKFDMSNAEAYMSEMADLHAGWRDKTFYAMPILESGRVADRMTGPEEMYRIKSVLDKHKDMVLNVRVGGNDFSNLYGLRRRVDQTIYDLGPIRDILSCILSVFSGDYVVSGPVWEYFGSRSGGAWESGLRRELELDRANGFIGKTAIHPCQLPAITDSLKVTQEDYWDATRILSWDGGGLAVGKGGGAVSRMNEVKCHGRWAEKVAALGQIYGFRGEKNDMGAKLAV